MLQWSSYLEHESVKFYNNGTEVFKFTESDASNILQKFGTEELEKYRIGNYVSYLD